MKYLQRPCALVVLLLFSSCDRTEEVSCLSPNPSDVAVEIKRVEISQPEAGMVALIEVCGQGKQEFIVELALPDQDAHLFSSMTLKTRIDALVGQSSRMIFSGRGSVRSHDSQRGNKVRISRINHLRYDQYFESSK